MGRATPPRATCDCWTQSPVHPVRDPRVSRFGIEGCSEWKWHQVPAHQVQTGAGETVALRVKPDLQCLEHWELGGLVLFLNELDLPKHAPKLPVPRLPKPSVIIE